MLFLIVFLFSDYHEYFLKGKIHLCSHIARTKIKGTGVRPKSNPEGEPDFYKDLPWVSSTTPTTTLPMGSAQSSKEEAPMAELSSSSLLDPSPTAPYNWLCAPPLLFHPSKVQDQVTAATTMTSSTLASSRESFAVTDSSSAGDGDDDSSPDEGEQGSVSSFCSTEDSSWLSSSYATSSTFSPTSSSASSCSSLLLNDDNAGEDNGPPPSCCAASKFEPSTTLVSLLRNSTSSLLQVPNFSSSTSCTTTAPLGSDRDPVIACMEGNTKNTDSSSQEIYTLFGKSFQALDTLPVEQLFLLKEKLEQSNEDERRNDDLHPQRPYTHDILSSALDSTQDLCSLL